jgi:hypothetical protein
MGEPKEAVLLAWGRMFLKEDGEGKVRKGKRKFGAGFNCNNQMANSLAARIFKRLAGVRVVAIAQHAIGQVNEEDQENYDNQQFSRHIYYPIMLGIIRDSLRPIGSFNHVLTQVKRKNYWSSKKPHRMSLIFFLTLMTFCHNIPGMNPLKVTIPLEYADALGVDPTHLSHVNAGRRQLSALSAIKLLELAQKEGDSRLEGLTIFMLRPEASAYQKFFLKVFKRNGRRLRRQCEVKSCPILKAVSL